MNEVHAHMRQVIEDQPREMAALISDIQAQTAHMRQVIEDQPREMAALIADVQARMAEFALRAGGRRL